MSRILSNKLGAATRFLVAFFMLHIALAAAQAPVPADVRQAAETLRTVTSRDGRWTLEASRHPDALALRDASGQTVRTFPLATLDGTTRTRVAHMDDDGPRQSFVVALQDIPELWEISYDPKAEPIYNGLVHDYRMSEAIAAPGFLGVRRTPLDEPLQAFVLDPSGRRVIGVTQAQGLAAPRGQVIHLDVRRRIASFALPGVPDMAAAVRITRNGTALLGIPLHGSGCVAVLDMGSWQVLAPDTAQGDCPSVRDWAGADGVIAPRSAPDAIHQ